MLPGRNASQPSANADRGKLTMNEYIVLFFIWSGVVAWAVFLTLILCIIASLFDSRPTFTFPHHINNNFEVDDNPRIQELQYFINLNLERIDQYRHELRELKPTVHY